MKEAVERLKGKAEAESMRTYINSLWKWKLSNVENNYYATFFKICSEGERLIILSNLYNRKLHEHLHFAFRSTLREATRRHSRKRLLTQKYLTRKLNNYFQRFKLGACIEEAKTWRTKFIETINGKKWIDFLEAFVRRKLADVLSQLQRHANRQKITYKLQDKLNRVSLIKMKYAFSAIRSTGIIRFYDMVLFAWNTVQCRLTAESFRVIKLTIFTHKLAEKITKISEKELKKHGYTKMVNKANLAVRSRISLNLMVYMFEQRLAKNKQAIIACFNRNARKIHSLNYLSAIIKTKSTQNQRHFYRILADDLEKKKLLNRFKKGMIIKKILDREDKKVLAKYFEELKKKENKWMTDSIRKFVIRSNIKTSMAVSFWRFRNY
jgi:hypothetical protein